MTIDMAISRKRSARKKYSVAEARHNLPALVHDAERGTMVEVTRRGRAVAVLMSLDRYARLERRRPDFWGALQDFRRNTDLEALGVDDAFVDSLRDRSTGRDVDL
jgi:prevent-host-death family protein